MRTILQKLIWLYQAVVSPFSAPSCRFYPSCSQYAAEAIETYGTLTGFWLTVKRLGKCHPFHRGGVDLVPDALNKNGGDAAQVSSCTGHHHG